MHVEMGLVKKALSSCWLSSGTSSVVCSVFLEQKNEGDPQTDVRFPNQSARSVHASIRSIIESSLGVKSRSTQVKVSLYIVTEGDDILSCCLNSFSLCMRSSGLSVCDVICSATIYSDGREVSMDPRKGLFPMHMAYGLETERIMQICTEGALSLEYFPEAVNELILACRRAGDWMREAADVL